MDTNEYSVCDWEKYLLICWAVGLCKCCALTRHCWNCHISALNGLKWVLKSWTYVNIFKTQPGQSLWAGKKAYAWKSINIITPYDMSLAFFFDLSATSYCWKQCIRQDNTLIWCNFTENVVWWIHCDSQNLKTTTRLKNQPIKIPKLYLFLVLTYNSSNCFISNCGELQENKE